MKIMKIFKRNEGHDGRRFSCLYACEHCGFEYTGVGRNDHEFLEEFLPFLVCLRCEKSTRKRSWWKNLLWTDRTFTQIFCHEEWNSEKKFNLFCECKHCQAKQRLEDINAEELLAKTSEFIHGHKLVNTYAATKLEEKDVRGTQCTTQDT